ncbi:uncharacterized protein LOC111715705 isoform X2 [Eurytemora carolleeae]|uniref:uncharacterized protein LOC111715705 isoform X2 n=1 Tax=Eurytemora carolleeae TaxID=1294199 RepID=UPI000C768C78|nr:uncharacterized protein LOC111715705 isoform X2 [Eurytemora carolleeae]|eukprot:XP_023346846.1 uncharacterized protein LOC111715705 isoform X2 [Eurytemora affinis]
MQNEHFSYYFDENNDIKRIMNDIDIMLYSVISFLVMNVQFFIRQLKFANIKITRWIKELVTSYTEYEAERLQVCYFCSVDLGDEKTRDKDKLEFSRWKERQLAEQERIRHLESTPEPPSRPPKNPNLFQKDLNPQFIQKQTKPDLFTPKPFTSNGLQQRLKPVVPPKPVFKPITENYLNCMRASEQSSKPNINHRLSSKLSIQNGGFYKSPAKSSNIEFQPEVNVSTSCNINTDYVTDRARLVRVDSQLSDRSVSSDSHSYGLTHPKESNQEETKLILSSTKHERRESNIDNEKSFSTQKSLNDSDLKEELKRAQKEKCQLIIRINAKLNILREEKEFIESEIHENEDLAEQVCGQLEGLATIREVDRIRRHMDEVGKVTSLVLALSSRLARLEAEDPNIQDQDEILWKKNKLRQQLEEAKNLQELSNSRRHNLTSIISGYLDTMWTHNLDIYLTRYLDTVWTQNRYIFNRIFRYSVD